MNVRRTHPYARPCLALVFALVAVSSDLAAQSGWQAVSVINRRPTGRGFHSLAYDFGRGVTVLFGGWNNAALGDTWEWDGVAWAQRSPMTSPPARCCYAIAYDVTRGRVVLFGGTNNTVDFADTWEWDGVNWTQRMPANAPSPRRQVRAAFDWSIGRVVIFGGGVGGLGTPTHADAWEWTGSDWVQRTSAPSPRWSHGLAYDAMNQGLLVYGGSPSGGVVPLGDTWLASAGSWVQSNPAISPPPLTRVQIADHPLRGLIALFGGQNGAFSDQTWIWDGFTWTQDPRPGPSARGEHGVAFDLARDRLVLFGGYDGSYHSDTWEYSPGGLATWHPFGNACSGTAGPPRLALAGSSRPVLGSIVTLELAGVASAVSTWVALGLSDQTAGGVPLPIALSGIGMTGCVLFASVDATVQVPISAGVAVLPLQVPIDPALYGAMVFATGIAVEPGANPLGVLLSNACALTIGAF